MVLPPCAWNLNSRLNGEVTAFSGETRTRSGRRVIARVVIGTFVPDAGGSAASSALINTLPAFAEPPIKAIVKRHEAIIVDFITDLTRLAPCMLTTRRPA